MIAVSFTTPPTPLSPGQRATFEVRVRNTSNVVDRFSVAVLGEAAPWSMVEPATFSLLPAEEEALLVHLDVPRSSAVAAGEMAFGVKVVSEEHPTSSVVEEGTLTVAPFIDLSGEIVPRTSNASRRARHEVYVENKSNIALDVALRATDPDDLIQISCEPAMVHVAAGEQKRVDVRLRTRRSFLRGPAQHRPFQVVLDSDGQPVVLGAALEQGPLVSNLAARSTGFLLLGAAVLAGLWLTVLKPAVKSAAVDAVATPLAGQQVQNNEQRGAINELLAAAGKQRLPVPGGDPDPPDGSSDDSDEPAEATVVQPFDHRLEVNGPGVSERERLVGEKETVSLTDLLLQNPMANTGIIEIRRGDETLLRQALDNFRDFDVHFVSPILFQAGERIVLHVECANPDGAACSAAAYVSGVRQAAA